MTEEYHQMSCGSPNAEPKIMTNDVKKECPKHCISHQQFEENDVNIFANGTLEIIKSGNIFKVILNSFHNAYQLIVKVVMQNYL